MNNIYITIKAGILSDVDYNGYYSISLLIITLAVILSGIFVIISKNPILSVLYLICLFLCVSSYLMLLGLNFIGLSYLLVYVGAVSILFLFILMLINIRISEITGFSNDSIPLGIFITTTFLFAIDSGLPLLNNTLHTLYNYLFDMGILKNSSKQNIDVYNIFNMPNTNNAILNSENDMVTVNKYLSTSELIDNKQILYNVYSSSWDNILTQSSYINSIGNILYTSYPLWIILTSLVLLLAMVGCIIITMRN